MTGDKAESPKSGFWVASLGRRHWLVCVFACVFSLGLNAQTAHGNAKDRKLKTGEAPVYPQLAKNQHITGTVNADLVIAANGTIQGVRAKGHPLLVDAVLQALKTWKYEPASKGMLKTVSFEFR